MSDQRKTDSAATSSLSSTRQLLDELDALMQRMLELPVGDTPEEAKPSEAPVAAAVESPPVPKPAPKPAPTPAPAANKTTPPRPATLPKPPSYKYTPPEPEEAPAPAPPQEDEQESAPEEAEASDQTVANPFRFARGRINPVSSEKLATLTSSNKSLANEPLIQRSRLLAAGAVRRYRWWHWPFRLINGAFDLLTYLLGPLGAWLRQPVGRTFLGWVGVALLLAALGLQIALWVAW